VVSAKASAALLVVALLVVAFRAMVRMGTPGALALVLLSGVLACYPGQLAMWSVRGDTLPLLLQLMATVWVTEHSGAHARRWVLGAAVLCALALLAKSTAVWAPVAIAAWLWLRDRRLCFEFVVSYLIVVSVGLWGFNAYSQGRMLENLLQLSTAGLIGPTSLLKAPLKLNHFLIHDATALWATLPIAVAGAISALRSRQLQLYQLALVAALLILIVVLADDGAMQNHLLDVSLLAAVCSAWTWTRVGKPVDTSLVLGALLLWSSASTFATLAWPRVQEAVIAKLTGRAPETERLSWLASLMNAGELVLSEDPLIPILHGQRPIITDAYMLPTITQRHPEWTERGLRARIAQHEFDRVILLRAADPTDSWYQRHFGKEVITSVREHYRETQALHGYHIYQPK
jgi:hypothetical protein